MVNYGDFSIRNNSFYSPFINGSFSGFVPQFFNSNQMSFWGLNSASSSNIWNFSIGQLNGNQLPGFHTFNFNNTFSDFSAVQANANRLPGFNMFNINNPFPYFNISNPFSIRQNNTGTTADNSQSTQQTTQNSQSSSVRSQMVAKASSYVGKVNSSAEGNRLFSPAGYQNTPWYKQHGKWGWCCDFAVYCAKQTLGSKYPKDMVTSSPQGLVSGAKKHNAYMPVPASGQSTWLTANVKPADIIYKGGKGPSGKHIAVVESVKPDGTITAISGNSGGKVKRVTYKIGEIQGFISLDKIAA